jgi:hypothetical protein
VGPPLGSRDTGGPGYTPPGRRRIRGHSSNRRHGEFGFGLLHPDRRSRAAARRRLAADQALGAQ